MGVIDKIFNCMGFEINVEDDDTNEVPQVKNRYDARLERQYNKASVPVQTTTQRKNKIFDLPNQAQSKLQVAIYKPQYFDDIRITADELKNGKPVIINFTEISDNSYQRMLDCLSGVLYAIDGDLVKISDYIYMASPKGVQAVGNITMESLLGGNFGSVLGR